MSWSDHITEKCKAAGVRLSILRNLPSAVCPLVKLNIYKTFIRPILEYGAPLFDNCTTEESNRLEAVQRQACLLISRAYRRTSTETLLNHLGLKTLKERRIKAKLTLFYKIVKGIAPQYLFSILPKEISTLTHYNLRNTNQMRNVFTKKEYLLKSFIPSTVTMWNSLSNELKAVESLSSFKLELSKYYGDGEVYEPYLVGNGTKYVHLSRIRLGLSALNHQRFSHSLINDATCGQCNHPLETAEHFFLECPAYLAARQVMLGNIAQHLPHESQQLITNINNKPSRNKLCKILLFGYGNHVGDTLIFQEATNYLENTLRFS